jgi:hypothetical protein
MLVMTDEIRTALAKGCLAGLALAVLFGIVSGLLYLAARAFGLDQGQALVIGVAGGPVIVSAVVLGGIMLRAQGRVYPATSSSDEHDATTTWDDT